MLGRVKKKSKNSVTVENLTVGVKRFYCSAKNSFKGVFSNIQIGDFVNIFGEEDIYAVEIIKENKR